MFMIMLRTFLLTMIMIESYFNQNLLFYFLSKFLYHLLILFNYHFIIFFNALGTNLFFSNKYYR